MVGGFNHNFCYKEQMFHIQTEDSGVKKAQITSLLYHGGVILARQTTSYSEIVGAADLAVRVETLMKEQHKQMLRDLKSGNFDEQIARLCSCGNTVEETLAAPQPQPTKSAAAAVVKQRDTARADEPQRDSAAAGLAQLVFSYLSAGRSNP